MTDHKRRSLITAAGVGSLLAIGSVAGAGSVLASPAELDQEGLLSSPDGYTLTVDDRGARALLDLDGIPLFSDDDYEDDYDQDDDYEDDEYEDDYEGDDDHDEDEDDDDDYEDDDYEDDDDDEEYGASGAVAPEVDAGQTYGIDEVVDIDSAGARLTIAFDEANDAFSGLVENTTSDAMTGLLVSVRLTDGTELETEPVDLAAGDVQEISLATDGASFDTYAVSVLVDGGEPMG